MIFINLAIYDGYSYNNEYINNVVDLGCNKNISDDIINNADIWTGVVLINHGIQMDIIKNIGINTIYCLKLLKL